MKKSKNTKRRLKNAFLIICASVLLLTGLAACSGKRDDKQFLKNLQSGLEKRWDGSTATEGKQYASDKEYREEIKSLIDLEKKALGEYETYTFEDAGLEQLAKRYYDALENQAEGIKYYGISDTDYYEYYTLKGYNERASVVYMLNKDYGLEFREKYDDTLTKFCVEGKKLEDLNTAIQNLSKTVSEQAVLSFIGNSLYELTLENTSGYDLENVTITVNGYEGDTVVSTGNGFLPQWGNGNKNNLEIYLNKSFDKATVTIEFSDYNGFEGKTEASEVTCQNDLIIHVEMPSLPSSEISYGYSNKVYTKCIVESITFEETYWDDGKANGVLKFSGSKTYDKDGNNYSRACQIGWKLYDMDGTVVESGNCYTSDAKVGESFKDSEAYVNAKLEPGEYRLELLNIN